MSDGSGTAPVVGSKCGWNLPGDNVTALLIDGKGASDGDPSHTFGDKTGPTRPLPMVVQSV